MRVTWLSWYYYQCHILISIIVIIFIFLCKFIYREVDVLNLLVCSECVHLICRHRWFCWWYCWWQLLISLSVLSFRRQTRSSKKASLDTAVSSSALTHAVVQLEAFLTIIICNCCKSAVCCCYLCRGGYLIPCIYLFAYLLDCQQLRSRASMLAGLHKKLQVVADLTQFRGDKIWWWSRSAFGSRVWLKYSLPLPDRTNFCRI